MSQPSSADHAEQPLTPDTQVTTASWDHLDRLIYVSIVDVSRCESGIFWRSELRHSQYVSADTVRAGDVQRGPGRRVGHANGADVSVVRVADGPPSSSSRVIGELVNGSPASVAACAELLNQSDVAVIQHEYGIYGGVDGDEVVDIIDGLRVPSIVIAHTILKDPTPHQRSVLEAVAARADQVVVMSEAAGQRLCRGFDVDRRKVTTIPHGATVPTNASVEAARSTDPVDLGPAGPGKGHRAGDRGDGVAQLICPAGRGTWLPAERTRRCWPPTARRTAMPESNRRGAAASRIRCPSTRATATFRC